MKIRTEEKQSKKYSYPHKKIWTGISVELNNRIDEYIARQKNEEIKGGIYSRSSFLRDAIIGFLNMEEKVTKIQKD